MEEYNVVSLFDGMGCGQIALNKVGIKYKNFYASEIDKYSMAVTNFNFPNTIQLGDVKNIDFTSLNNINLLIGGSPCQHFSIGNVNRGGFESDEGKLFYSYLKAKEILNPKYFLYENVSSMKNADRDFISNQLGIPAIMIDSSLFSAQVRKRYYWTNIEIGKISNKNIILNDILEKSTYKTFENVIYDKIDRKIEKDKSNRIGYINNLNRGNRVYSTDGKSITLTKSGGGLGSKTGLYLVDNIVRRLTVNESEELQTVPKDYTKIGIFNNKECIISNNQRYNMLGNGWTVDVIAHIFSSLI